MPRSRLRYSMFSASFFIEGAVHAGRRLVEEHQPRIGHQRARQLEKLLLPAESRPADSLAQPAKSTNSSTSIARSRISRSWRRTRPGRNQQFQNCSPA